MTTPDALSTDALSPDALSPDALSPYAPSPDAPSPDGFDPSPVLRPLLRDVPEFGPSYLALVAGCDDDPGEPVILMELAEFLSGHVTALHQGRPLIERILAVVEAHLESLDDDPVGCELVAYAFFDSLSPELRESLLPSVGPRSRALIEDLDALGDDQEY